MATLQFPVIVVVVVGLGAGGVALDHVLALVHVQDLNSSSISIGIGINTKSGGRIKLRIQGRICREKNIHSGSMYVADALGGRVAV